MCVGSQGLGLSRVPVVMKAIALVEEGITLFVMVGGWGQSAVENALRRAHQATARDLLEVLLGSGRIARTVVAADDAVWAQSLAGMPVEVDLDPADEPFHFGRRLAQLIGRYAAQRVLYVGGASAPLFSARHWDAVLAKLARAEQLVITNNLHSSDWIGFTSAGVVASQLAQADSDNSIAWLLSQRCGMPVETSPATAATRFDLDTPADLLIAQLHPGIGLHLKRFLAGLAWPTHYLDAVLAEMACEGGSLAVIGRVSESAWAMLERATRCWVRVYAEERGMRASGRLAQKQVRSLVGDYLQLVGPEAFFDTLAQMANGVLFDDRVLLATRGLWPSAADRFNSDLHRWEEVEDPFLRRFTRAAAEARIPVVLGGHSVVAGGLMALSEIHEFRQGRT